MIVVSSHHKQILHQWHYAECPYQLDFIVHNDALFSAFEDKDSLTLVYGFLDQEKKGLSNAHFMRDKINQLGIKKALNACYGSFILIHINKQTHELIFGNDALGDFALHYTLDNKHLCVSDLPSALLTNQNKQINQQRIVDFFALTQPVTQGCYFEQITQLSPGHFVRYKKGELIDERYYYPSTQVDFSSLSLAELAAKYQHLLKQAINWQTHNQTHVAVMMSGGMDSTFVAACCRQNGKKVSSFSYVFPEFKEADESQWIAAMNQLGIDCHQFAGENYWPLKPEWKTSVNSPVSNPYRLLKNKIYSQVAKNNIQTVLTGVYADHLYVAHIYWLVDLIKHQPIHALQLLPSLVKTEGLNQTLKHVSPQKWSRKIQSKPHWLSQHAQCIFQQRKKIHFQHPHPQQVNLVYGVDTAQSVWLDNEHSNPYGITLRHPYRDRRVVEFVTAIPAWLIGNAQETKLLIHKCAENILPDKITQRKTITSLKPLFIKGVLQQELPRVKNLLLHPKCQWPEFINQKIILSLINNPNDNHPELHYLLLWKCISFEMWLKKIKKSG